MDTATDRSSALHRAVFEDALGKRHYAVTPGGEPLEVLELRYELSNDACEAALRERVSALASVHSGCFARVRGVQRINQNTAKLFVLSERVSGARLSSVLAMARQTTVALDVNASLCLIRQLVSAIALLHEKMPNIAHGAIAPERVIVTPEARLVVADHAIGAALAQLHYSHDRFWKELRVPMVPGSDPTFNQRADVMQIGVLALELLLGRPIECAEYPDAIDELTQRAWRLNATATSKPLSVPLRAWLLRMLQVDPRASFSSVGAAWEELEAVLGGGMGASFSALEHVMAEYARKVAAAAAAAPAPAANAPVKPASTPAPVPVKPAPTTAPAPVASAPVYPRPVAPMPVAAAPVAPTPIASDRIASTPKPVAPAATPSAPKPVTPAAASVAAAPAPMTVSPAPVAATPAPKASEPQPPRDPAIASQSPRDPAIASQSPRDPAIAPQPPRDPAIAPPRVVAPAAPPRMIAPSSVTLFEAEPEPETTPQPAPRGRGRWIAAAALLALVVGGGAMFGRKLMMPPAAAEAPGTLVVTTTPAGVQVIVDGQSRGVTPLTVELAPGSHELKLVTDGEPRIVPFTVNAGSTVAQSFELAKVVSSSGGQLIIRSDPPGARVTIDGLPGGLTPVTIEGLTPGAHSVVLANDVASVTQEVTVEAGTTASLVVPMTAPQGVPVSGWISVSSPAEVQVYENSQLLGTSATDRIMVSAGKHEFVLANDAAGYRITRTVVVSPGKVSPIRVEWPNGSMALNAQPWAEVWVDGERVGETPIGNYTVPIGTHEVIFRHPQLGEQVVRATVTATAPARVSVDMRKR